MNLFINDIFINTLRSKVDILQLIRQIAEDDDLIQGEVVLILESNYGYSEDDLVEQDCLNATIEDGVLFLETEVIRYVFNSLYGTDYQEVIDRITRAIDDSTGIGTLRLDVKGHTFMPDTAVDFPEIPPVPKSYDTDFTGDTMVSPLNPTVGYLPKLFVKGQRVHLHVIEGKSGVLFGIHSLYFAAYGASYDTSYLGALITTYGLAIDPADVYFDKGVYFGNEKAISILHRDLATHAEFESMVSRVLKKYDAIINHPNEGQSQVSFDAHGNV